MPWPNGPDGGGVYPEEPLVHEVRPRRRGVTDNPWYGTDGGGEPGVVGWGLDRPPGADRWSGNRNRGGDRQQFELRISGSARHEQLRVLAGKCRVGGSFFGWYQDGDVTWVAYLFGIGPAVSVTNLKLGNDDLVGHPAYIDHEVHLGSPTEALDTTAQTKFGWATAYRWLVWCWVEFETVKLATVGIPSVRADVECSVYDFTGTLNGSPGWTDSGDGEAAHNPILGLYTYLAKNPWGPRKPDSQLDLTDSWDAAADWCWTLVSSRSRWRSRGIAPAGDTLAVIRAFLRSAWCTMPYRAGKWRLAPRTNDTTGAPTLTIESFRRQADSYSRKPTVIRLDFNNADDDWQADSRWARSSGLVSGSVPWILQNEKPPLLADPDVAQRDATFALAASQEEANHYTVRVDPYLEPDVLDVLPGHLVYVQDRNWAAARLMRVEDVKPGELVYQLRGYAGPISVASEPASTADTLPTITTSVDPATPTVGTRERKTRDDTALQFDYVTVAWSAGSGGGIVRHWRLETTTDGGTTVTVVADRVPVERTSYTWGHHPRAGHDSSDLTGLKDATLSVRVVAVGFHGGEAASTWSAFGAVEDIDAAEFDAGSLVGRDVHDTAPTDKQALVWDATNGWWAPSSTPRVVASGTAGNLADLNSDGTVGDSGYDPADFAAAGHNHDGVYSPTSHDHDSDYFPLSLPSRTIVSGGSLTDTTHLSRLYGGPYTVTLPDAASHAGEWIMLKNWDGAAYTVAAAGTDTIDGDASLQLTKKHETVILISGGTDWHRVTRHHHDGTYLQRLGSATTDNLAKFDSSDEVVDSGKSLSDLLQLAAGGTVSGNTTFTGRLTQREVVHGGSKTVTAGVSTSLWRENLTARTGDAGYYSIQVEVANATQAQTYWALVKWAAVYDGSANTVSGPTVVATDQAVSSGTITISHLIYSSVGGQIVHRINVGTSLLAATVTVTWTVFHTKGGHTVY